MRKEILKYWMTIPFAEIPEEVTKTLECCQCYRKISKNLLAGECYRTRKNASMICFMVVCQDCQKRGWKRHGKELVDPNPSVRMNRKDKER